MPIEHVIYLFFGGLHTVATELFLTSVYFHGGASKRATKTKQKGVPFDSLINHKPI